MCKDGMVIFTGCYSGKMSLFFQSFADGLGAHVLAASDKVQMQLLPLIKTYTSNQWKLSDGFNIIKEKKLATMLGIENNGHWVNFGPDGTTTHIYPKNVGITNKKSTKQVNHVIDIEDLWNL